jgi:hypothetical protein
MPKTEDDVKMTVLWVVAPRARLAYRPDDGGSKNL